MILSTSDQKNLEPPRNMAFLSVSQSSIITWIDTEKNVKMTRAVIRYFKCADDKSCLSILQKMKKYTFSRN